MSSISKRVYCKSICPYFFIVNIYKFTTKDLKKFIIANKIFHLKTIDAQTSFLKLEFCILKNIKNHNSNLFKITQTQYESILIGIYGHSISEIGFIRFSSLTKPILY